MHILNSLRIFVSIFQTKFLKKFLFLNKDIFKICGDVREAEASAKCNELEQKTSSDYYEAIKMPQHILIEVNCIQKKKKILYI